MNDFSMAGWAGFLSANAQAAAALAGLIFVALSINLSRIVSMPGLPGRAAESLIMLIGVLVICSIGLVPDISAQAAGLSFAFGGGVMWLLPTAIQVLSIRHRIPQPAGSFAARIVMTQLATLPFVISGVLLTTSGGGLDWLAPGAVFCFIASAINAWVLLVEIVR
ncbi:MAG TPA: hypothetical protein VGN05_13140 [Parvibaculum sp.]|jgi:modulator of FtsH protease